MNIEEKNEFLKNASVPEYLWGACYVPEDKSTYFTPHFTDLSLKEWDKVGEETYEEWINNKENTTE